MLFLQGTTSRPKYFLTDLTDNGIHRWVDFHSAKLIVIFTYSNYVNRTVGEILAISLVQGGPAPTIFKTMELQLPDGQINPTILNRDTVAKVHLQELIAQVQHGDNAA